MSPRTDLGVALSGHTFCLEQTLRLSRAADTAGLAAVFVDGDETRVPARSQAPLYDGGALSSAVLHGTRTVEVGAIRLPGLMHVAHSARALATQQLASGGRAFGFFGVGSGRHLEDLGLPAWSAGQRIACLEESIEAHRALWSGQPVTRRGHYLSLREVTAPRPDPPIRVTVAAAGPRAVALADRVADAWDANVPPLERFLAPLRQRLTRRLEVWLWVFARPGDTLERAVQAYRRLCPWFPPLRDEEWPRALLYGDATEWRDRASELGRALEVDRIVLDLGGLDEGLAHAAIRALGPASGGAMA